MIIFYFFFYFYSLFIALIDSAGLDYTPLHHNHFHSILRITYYWSLLEIFFGLSFANLISLRFHYLLLELFQSERLVWRQHSGLQSLKTRKYSTSNYCLILNMSFSFVLIQNYFKGIRIYYCEVDLSVAFGSRNLSIILVHTNAKYFDQLTCVLHMIYK